MKAVISNRIYIRPDRELLAKIEEELSHKIEKKVPQKGLSKFKIAIETIRTYRLHGQGLVSIPRGRLDLLPEGTEIVDKTIGNSVPFPTPLLSARPEQQEVIDQVHSDCFINAKVGWGKTFTALLIAAKLEQKTLIVTHNTMLRDQWITDVRRLFNIEPGVITAGKFDIEDHCIVIANVQTLTKHALTVSKEFGTLILDEAHHCPADTFANIIDNSYAKYRIALSGTIIRKDGKHVIFKDYFGSVLFQPKQSNTVNPEVRIIKTGVVLTPGETWVKKINNLLYDTDYQEYIAVLAAKQISDGHRVLIIADRVEFLNNVKELLGETCLLVTGSTSYEEREQVKQRINSGSCKAIAGSRGIFSEGISVDSLSCVILAIPIANEANLEQIIGRIMRIYPNKPKPLVLDLNFAGWADKKQNDLRLGFYMKQGWDMEVV